MPSIDEIMEVVLSENVISVEELKLHSVLEILYLVIDRVNQVIRATNYLVEDGVQDVVVSQLIKWLDDGTLNHLIQSQVFKDMTDKINSNKGRLDTLFVDVNGLGCVGDGVSDDTLALQNALTVASEVGANLTLNGQYKVSSSLNIPSNVKMIGIGKTKLIQTTANQPILKVTGEHLKTILTTGSNSIGGKSVSMDSVDGLVANSTHQLLSTISAFSDEAGTDFRLGTATSTTDDARLGEFIRISSVGTDKINLSTPLMMYHYPVGSALKVLALKEHIEIDNLIFEGTFTDATPLVDIEYARNVVVKDCQFIANQEGAFVFIKNSANCLMIQNKGYYKNPSVPSNYYFRNGFKLGSCQDCIIEKCDATGVSGQPFDLTYVPSSIPTIQCEISQCVSIGSVQTGITLHPATYQCRIVENTVRGRKDGITLRGKGHQCLANTLFNTDVSTQDSHIAYGISCAEGQGNQMIIANNKIQNYPRGIRIQEQNTTRNLSFNKELNILITGNHIMDYATAIFINRVTESTQEVVDGNILIEGNLITNMKWHTPANCYVIYISGSVEKEIKGIVFNNNLCSFNGIQPNALIRSDVTADLVLMNNTFIGLEQRNDQYIYYGSKYRILSVYAKTNVIDNLLIGRVSGSAEDQDLVKDSTKYIVEG